MPVSPARRAAWEVLLRVERDSSYAADALRSPRYQALDPRDLALATEIALGVLRRRGELDHLIESTAGRPVAALDPEVRAALRVGAYQIAHLDRVPRRAAVSESVELVKQSPRRSAAGLVNAVLRRLPPSPDPARAVARCYPAWLLDRWRCHYGETTAARIAAAQLETPGQYLRLAPGEQAEEVLRALSAGGVETEPAGSGKQASRPVRRAYRVTRGSAAASNPVRAGRARLQDLGSQAIVPLLELQPGVNLLDLCAAPGGKSVQAAEEIGPGGRIIACDLHHHRLRRMRIPEGHPIHRAQLDAARPLPFREPFERILADVPCSGTGTLARNPEIKWRLQPEDLPRLQELQVRILAHALEALAPSGVLVYSTCSLEREENEDVIEAALAGRSAFQSDAYFQTVPGVDEGDGFFACRIRRVSGPTPPPPTQP